METSLCALEVRVNGRPVKELYHNGAIWIEGRKGSEFTLRLRNRTPGRLLMIPSIDGLSVMDGEEASYHNGGYVVEGNGYVDVPGWRLSDTEVAKFKFKKSGKSYAAKSGKPKNIGVIGCAVYQEAVRTVLTRTYRPRGGCGQSMRADPEGYEYIVSNCSAASGTSTVYMNSTTGEEPTKGAVMDSMTPSLGTEFGKKSEHHVESVTFNNATKDPAEVITVRYGDRDELISRGIDLKQKPKAATPPSAFPVEQGCKPPADWQG